MNGYYSLDIKKPKEGQEVYVCTVLGGVHRFTYENGWFVNRDHEDNEVMLDAKVVLKWREIE